MSSKLPMHEMLEEFSAMADEYRQTAVDDTDILMAMISLSLELRALRMAVQMNSMLKYSPALRPGANLP